jgi:hypothetical protein
MEFGKITAEDKRIISQGLKCSVRQITHVISGKRGVRETNLQKEIRKALELRQNQNKELLEKCLNVPVVSLTPVKCKGNF